MLISPAKLCTEEIVQVLDLQILLNFNRTNDVFKQCIMKS